MRRNDTRLSEPRCFRPCPSAGIAATSIFRIGRGPKLGQSTRPAERGTVGTDGAAGVIRAAEAGPSAGETASRMRLSVPSSPLPSRPALQIFGGSVFINASLDVEAPS